MSGTHLTDCPIAIVFVYDYHPCSKTLAEAHFGTAPVFGGSRHVPENVIWSYIVQIASALKTIHNTGLAARIIDASKVLVTSKMRYFNFPSLPPPLLPDVESFLSKSTQNSP